MQQRFKYSNPKEQVSSECFFLFLLTFQKNPKNSSEYFIRNSSTDLFLFKAKFYENFYRHSCRSLPRIPWEKPISIRFKKQTGVQFKIFLKKNLQRNSSEVSSYTLPAPSLEIARRVHYFLWRFLKKFILGFLNKTFHEFL